MYFKEISFESIEYLFLAIKICMPKDIGMNDWIANVNNLNSVQCPDEIWCLEEFWSYP